MMSRTRHSLPFILALLLPGCIELPTSESGVVPVTRTDMAQPQGDMGGGVPCEIPGQQEPGERVGEACWARCVRGREFCEQKKQGLRRAYRDEQGQLKLAQSFGMALAALPNGEWLSVSAPFDPPGAPNDPSGIVFVYPPFGDTYTATPLAINVVKEKKVCGLGASLSVMRGGDEAAVIDAGAPCSGDQGQVWTARCGIGKCQFETGLEPPNKKIYTQWGIKVDRIQGEPLYASVNGVFAFYPAEETPYELVGNGESMVLAEVEKEWFLGMHIDQGESSKGWHLIYPRTKRSFGKDYFENARSARLVIAEQKFARAYGADLSAGRRGQMAMLSGSESQVKLTVAFDLLGTLEQNDRNAASLVDRAKRVSVETGFMANVEGITQVKFDQAGNVWVFGQERDVEGMVFRVYALKGEDTKAPELVLIKRVNLRNASPREVSHGETYIPRFLLVGEDKTYGIASKVLVSAVGEDADSKSVGGEVRQYCVTPLCGKDN